MFTFFMIKEASNIQIICVVNTLPLNVVTRYSSTLYIGIAIVVRILQYIRKCQFLYFQF